MNVDVLSDMLEALLLEKKPSKHPLAFGVICEEDFSQIDLIEHHLAMPP
ncbi:MAG: hypothetical protein ACXV5F_06330 [Halobacteriota archaeon]